MLQVEQTNNSLPGKPRLADAAASENKGLPVHRWVPWIAGFSAPFVQDVISAYLPKGLRKNALVLDPFAGVGTTLVESLKLGLDCTGYEINAYAALSARAKIECITVEPHDFQERIEAFRLALAVSEEAIDALWTEENTVDLGKLVNQLQCYAPSQFKSRIPFFSQAVEAKCLSALKLIANVPEPHQTLFRVAFGATMVSVSNYTYEPSLGSRPGAGKPLIDNVPVGPVFTAKLLQMLEDIRWARERFSPWLHTERAVHHGSYFDSELAPNSVSLVITSPPYLNNYHYVRNTRPQLYWLGLIANSRQLKEYEKASFGTFWQTVRQGPQIELGFDLPCLEDKLTELQAVNPDRGVYGGRGWANYAATYFNDSWRLLEKLNGQLKRGAYAVIVVGNSFIQGKEFAVDQLLAEMAVRHGLSVAGIEVVREKRVGNSIIRSSVRDEAASTLTQAKLYDAAVILRKS